MSSFVTIEWKDQAVRMIDQRKLPSREEYLVCETYKDVAMCIREMVIRGAPAIGVAAAMGIALGALKDTSDDKERFFEDLARITETITATRPTAVNLFWAARRMNDVARGNEGLTVPELRSKLVLAAREMCEEDVRVCREIGRNGATLLEDGMTVMTHCNAGALATAGYGTALGVIRAAIEAGKKIHVIANETRPFLQGARLTAWELMKDDIPVTLITDNMAGYVMSRGMVDAIVVGADRVAGGNGDVANKIGTYSLSILAKSHGIPFYVAAPVSTIDFECASGDQIPIEERSGEEVTHCAGVKIAPDVGVFNPAFDITPGENVSSLITEKGVSRSPYAASLGSLKDK